jgi:hypothetical protein
LASPFWSGSFDWWRTGPRYLVLLSWFLVDIMIFSGWFATC